MIKKAYEQPTMKVVQIQQTQLICASLTSVQSSGLDSEDDLEYDKNGGDQGSAWARKHNGAWDDEEEW